MPVATGLVEDRPAAKGAVAAACQNGAGVTVLGIEPAPLPGQPCRAVQSSLAPPWYAAAQAPRRGPAAVRRAVAGPTSAVTPAAPPRDYRQPWPTVPGRAPPQPCRPGRVTRPLPAGHRRSRRVARLLASSATSRHSPGRRTEAVR